MSSQTPDCRVQHTKPISLFEINNRFPLAQHGTIIAPPTSPQAPVRARVPLSKKTMKSSSQSPAIHTKETNPNPRIQHTISPSPPLPSPFPCRRSNLLLLHPHPHPHPHPSDRKTTPPPFQNEIYAPNLDSDTRLTSTHLSHISTLSTTKNYSSRKRDISVVSRSIH